jgi:dTDP-4-amino-4,6-dideoxygalactose transaminase
MVNDPELAKRAEIIWEKGTNRAAFWRGEVDKYNWVDIGSSFLPSEINAAYLYAQLEQMDDIQTKRKQIWNQYTEGLSPLFVQEKLIAPSIPDHATNNGHMFYLVCHSLEQRDALLAHLKAKGIYAVFHYQSLHSSPFYHQRHDGRALPQSDRYSDCLVRLPIYIGLSAKHVQVICDTIHTFFQQ